MTRRRRTLRPQAIISAMLDRILNPYRRARERFRFLEPLVLIAIMILWGMISAFLEISDDVMEGDTHDLDRRLMLLLRDGTDPQNPLGPHWVQEMVRDISGLGGIVILAMVVVSAALYLLMMRKPFQALYLIAAASLSTALSNALKYGFGRPRPDLVPHGSFVFTNSFPSGHSMMAAMVYLSVGMLLARAHGSYRMKIYFLATSIFLTIAIGISRVYLGVHWPSDVLAGWLVGGACAVGFWLLEWAWQEKVWTMFRRSASPEQSRGP